MKSIREGSSVVCISEDFPWIKKHGGSGPAKDHPKKGEILIVDEILGEFLRFDKYDTEESFNWWHITRFAPIEEDFESELERELEEFLTPNKGYGTKGKTLTAVNLKNIDIQVDGVTVYLNGDTLHVIDNYNPGKIKDLQEEITILREQLRGTREELAQVRKGGIENEEKKPTPEERFWEILKGCVVETSEKYPRSTFLLKDGKFFFEFEKDTLWCSWNNVWSVFEKEFNMSYNDIQNLINIQVEEHFKCNWGNS